MLGIYRVAAQLVASQVVLSSTKLELVAKEESLIVPSASVIADQMPDKDV
jgi:hypothetical protein